MTQISILIKLRFKSKCKFYKSFFSMNSLKACYIFFLLKEIFSFVLTSLVLVFFYKNIGDIGLSHRAVLAILIVLVLAQVMGSNKTTKNFIRTNLNSYRMATRTYPSFLRKTVLTHAIVELIYSLPSLVPVLIFAFFWDPQYAPYIFLVLAIALVIKMNGMAHSLTEDQEGKYRGLVSFLKSSFLFILVFVFMTFAFNLVRTALAIIKVLLTKSHYDEALLLNDLLLSITDTWTHFKAVYQDYKPFIYLYLAVLLVLPFIYNLVQYHDLWRNKFRGYYLETDFPQVKTSSYGQALPFYKEIYRQGLDGVFLQLRKQAEIFVLPALEFVMLKNMGGDHGKFLLILWLYYIGNSNYIRSLFILGYGAFGQYQDRVDLFYWRLSPREVSGMYQERYKLLVRASYKITWIQTLVAAGFSIYFIDRIWLALGLTCLLLLLREKVQTFNCSLSSFSSYFSFANACKSELREADSDESEFIEDRMQNIFKLPFTLIPMLVLLVNYIYSFLNLPINLLVLGGMAAIAISINRHVGQYIEKGSGILEKVHVLD